VPIPDTQFSLGGEEDGGEVDGNGGGEKVGICPLLPSASD